MDGSFIQYIALVISGRYNCLMMKHTVKKNRSPSVSRYVKLSESSVIVYKFKDVLCQIWLYIIHLFSIYVLLALGVGKHTLEKKED